MNVIEAIKNRRSINFFDKTKEVKKWLISDLIELAALSPSSYNLQPWEIIAVENPKRKSVLKKCAFNQPKAEEASVIFIIIANPGAVEQNIEAVLKYQVDSGLINEEEVESRKELPLKLYGKADSLERKLFAVKNASLFAMSLMIAAKGLGLASHPMDGFDQEMLKKEFSIPGDMIVPMLVAVGYPSENMVLTKRGYRRDMKDFLRYDNYK